MDTEQIALLMPSSGRLDEMNWDVSERPKHEMLHITEGRVRHMLSWDVGLLPWDGQVPYHHPF